LSEKTGGISGAGAGLKNWSLNFMPPVWPVSGTEAVQRVKIQDNFRPKKLYFSIEKKPVSLGFTF
jgi:hypothetical protein